MEKPSLLWLSLMNDTAQKTEEILNRILHFFLFIFFFLECVNVTVSDLNI